MLTKLRRGVARQAQCRHQPGMVLRPFIERQRIFKRGQGLLDVSAAKLNGPQRGEFARRLAVIAASGKDFECFGVQPKRAIELSKSDQAVSQIADERRVQVRIAIALDEWQHRIEHLDRLRGVAPPHGSGRQILDRAHLEHLVVAGNRAHADCLVDGHTGFVVA